MNKPANSPLAGLLGTLICCCLLLACARGDLPPPPELFQHWIHSFEESSALQTVYRPVTYSFAPARGRDGFEIREDGIFISHPIAPGDGNMTIEEKWVLHDHELVVTGRGNNQRYKLVSVTKDRLVLQRIVEN